MPKKRKPTKPRVKAASRRKIVAGLKRSLEKNPNLLKELARRMKQDPIVE